MDWIKKNYDRFTLAVLAVALIAAAALLWSKVSSFDDNFAAAMAQPVQNNTIVAVDTAKIDEARQQFEKPVLWTPRKGADGKLLHSGLLFTSERYYVNKVRQLEKPGEGFLYNDSLTGQPIENSWFIDHNLPLLDSTVQFQDPDADGFLNEDEWRGKTDPNNKDSHPAYETKLSFRALVTEPFKFKFEAYDGDPKTDKPETMSYQINPFDLSGRSQFLKLGETIRGTRFKLSKFEFKEKPNPRTGINTDVSELTVENLDGEKVILIKGEIVASATQYGDFEYFWGKKHGEPGLAFRVRKLQEFALPPRIDSKDRYKLLDVNNDGALIQRPDGEKIKVPLVPKK